MRRTSLVLLASLLGFYSSSAIAESSFEIQDLADLSLEELGEVVVETTTRFPERASVAPGSTSRITEQQWRQFGSRRTLDAVGKAPGVYVSQLSNGISVPNFRGFGSTTSFKGYAAQLDGVPLNSYTLQSQAFPFPEVPLGNLKSIEVTRGPGSALYGTDAFLGTVALNTWDAKEDTTEVIGSGGSFGYHSETVRTAQSLNEDWRVTLIGTYSNLSDQHQDFRFTSAQDGAEVNEKIDNAYNVGGYLAKISSDSLEFAYHYFNFNSDEVPGHPAIPSQQVFNGATANLQASESIYRMRWTPEINDDLSLDLKTFFVGGQSMATVTSGPAPSVMIGDERRQRARQADQRTGLDIALKKPFNNERYQVLGGYAFDWMENRSYSNGPLGMEQRADGDGAHRDINSAYGQLELIAIEDLLRLTFGGRYDYYSDFGGQVSPRAAAILSPSDNSVIKLMYGRAFRAPSLLEQIGSPGSVAPGGDSLNPEEIDTYELAFSYGKENYRFGVTGFYNEIRDGIQVAPNTTGIERFRWANTAEAQSYGTETEFSYSFDFVKFEGNYTYVQAYQSEPEHDSDLYRAFPRHIVHSAITVNPIADLSLSLLNTNYFSMRSGLPSTPGVHDANTENLPAYWKTDFHVGYTLPILEFESELFLHLEDIFDRKDVYAAATSVERGIYGSGFAALVGIQIQLQ